MFSKIVFVLGVTIIGSAIACDLSPNWGPACKAPQIVPMDEAHKKAIVDAHNKVRSEIANGKIPNYDSAANMATIQWDDGLAANAALNVHQCVMKHDSCHTDTFPSSGQNLAMGMTTAEAETEPDQIASHVNGWFKEHENGKFYGWMDNINNFSTIGDPQHWVGHFTQVVWASTTKVGCAASTSKSHSNGYDWNATWLACDYSFGNMQGSPAYISGEPASQCQSGENPNQPGLCSTAEEYQN